MDTTQLIQFGVLALLVVIIAIAMRRGQTVQPPPGSRNEGTHTDNSRAEQGEMPDDTVHTGERKKQTKR